MSEEDEVIEDRFDSASDLSSEASSGEEWSGIHLVENDDIDALPARKRVRWSDPIESPSAAASRLELAMAPQTYTAPQARKMADGASGSTTFAQASISAASVAAGSATLITPTNPRLRRSLLGLLNRLSAANLLVVLPDIEAIYRTYPRAEVTDALTELLSRILSARDEVGANLIITYAGLVAALSRIVGKEVSAIVLARLVELYDSLRTSTSPVAVGSTAMSQTPRDDKASLNLVTFMVELYNVQVIACTLIYDLVRELVESGLHENDIEVLLRVLNSARFVLLW